MASTSTKAAQTRRRAAAKPNGNGDGRLKVEYVAIDKLKPWSDNPQVHSPEQVAEIGRSIAGFGMVEPILVRRADREVIAGHGRLDSLKAAGATEAPVIFLDLPKKRAHALALALNKIAEKSPWDEEKLRHVIKSLEDMGDDLSLTGFDASELRELTASPLDLIPNEDEVPDPPKKAITQPGDVWILGDHRLLCGDSQIQKDVAKSMNGQMATLWATDPPYCVDYTGNDRPKCGGKDWSDLYNETEIADLSGFLKAVFTVGLRHVADDAALYLWHADKRRATIEEVASDCGLLIHQQIIWVKPCIVFGYSFYAWRHEPCVLMWRKGNKPPIEKRRRALTNAQSTVWPVGFLKSGDPNTPEYYSDVWELDFDGKKRRNGPHPTMKPVEIFAIPMRIHTQPGDLCYEPFSGSGTQIIAAEKLGRRCYAIEKSPVFCDVAVERWEQYAGGKAKREKA